MYKHTQIGWIILVISTPVILILAFWAAINPILAAIIAIIVLIVMLALFTSLTVVGNSDEIRFYFGPGVIKKRIRYNQIKSARKVRSHWYYGWGIRWYGRGWLYNVSGLDAIELELTDNTELRIGTDEPDKLLAFLESKIHS